jgi:hypothetical protein
MTCFGYFFSLLDLAAFARVVECPSAVRPTGLSRPLDGAGAVANIAP